jgi:hypothetical protein
VFVVTARGEGDVTLLGVCDGVEASTAIRLVPWEERP